MPENRDFAVPDNIVIPFVRAPFSWDAQHATMCLDISGVRLSRYIGLSRYLRVIEIKIIEFFI